MGKIEVITGPMSAGKTEELIRRARRALIAKKIVLVLKPAVDRRYAMDKVCTHDGVCITAIPCASSEGVWAAIDTWLSFHKKLPDVVAIDEAQFFDEGILAAVSSLAEVVKRVIVCGTDMDFKGDPFGSMGNLMAIAERVDKLSAICVKCGKEATRNQRLREGKPVPATDPVVQVGGLESYEARCRDCHEVPLT